LRPGSACSPAVGGGTNFGTFDATGKTLPFSPDWTVDVPLDYAIPTAVGKCPINGTYGYNSGWFAEPDKRLREGSYNLVNASLAWHSLADDYRVRLWGKNFSNTQYLVALASQSNGDFAQYAPPRTYGIELEKRF
jgi:iron complex outermembrane receptor protein